MVRTSENTAIEQFSSVKVNQIDIWRNEVNKARNYCVCSKPTMVAPRPQGAIKDAVPNSSSSTAIDSDNRPESTKQPIDNSGPSHQPAKPAEPAEPANPFNPRGAPATSLALKLGCPVCAELIDESVTFEVLRERGERGLVRGRASTRSEASFSNVGQIVSHDKYKSPASVRVKRAVSKPLQQLKRAASFEDEKSSDKSKSKGKGKAKAVFGPLRKLLRWSSKESLSSDGPQTRPRATEMYHAYRVNAVEAEETSAGSVETLLSSLSDERKRPRLTIDESAARLRRAQRLLERERKK
ncbi:hypothetical protein F5Y13DRAFT_140164 [Hypoxylon sp. FL1857]|nr:hypothetical protein F5Y13DRAFT_140164 [Hypoxylon sp. FL1857]